MRSGIGNVLMKLPEGTDVLFFIQIFSTLAYAILYSTLELFMQQKLHVPVFQTNAILGGFLAFNYVLHLLGGILGGRYLSFRSFFVIGMLFQTVGCVLLSQVSFYSALWGIALFLVGSGFNLICINMMLTQRFSMEDKRREGAFLWNYSGMNLGFWLGFAIAGYFQVTESYHALFLLDFFRNYKTLCI